MRWRSLCDLHTEGPMLNKLHRDQQSDVSDIPAHLQTFYVRLFLFKTKLIEGRGGGEYNTPPPSPFLDHTNYNHQNIK